MCLFEAAERCWQPPPSLLPLAVTQLRTHCSPKPSATTYKPANPPSCVLKALTKSICASDTFFFDAEAAPPRSTVPIVPTKSSALHERDTGRQPPVREIIETLLRAFIIFLYTFKADFDDTETAAPRAAPHERTRSKIYLHKDGIAQQPEAQDIIRALLEAFIGFLYARKKGCSQRRRCGSSSTSRISHCERRRGDPYTLLHCAASRDRVIIGKLSVTLSAF